MASPWFIIAIVCSFIAAILVLVDLISTIRTPTGTLKIDHTNPEKDTYRFEIDDLDQLDHKKEVILYIQNIHNHSQK